MNAYNIIVILVVIFIVWFYAFVTLKRQTFFGAEKNSTAVKMKKSVHVPKFMLELYENGGNLTSPDIVRSVIPKETGFIIDNNEILDEILDKHILVFELPQHDFGEVFFGADLKILTILNNNLTCLKRNIMVSIFNETLNHFIPYQDLELKHQNNTWVNVDLTKPLLDILPNSKMFRILITYIKTHITLSIKPLNANLDHDYPVLMLYYTNKEKVIQNTRRSKRNIDYDYEEETNNVLEDLKVKKFKKRNTCRRKPLYINFREIDYHLWIIQPSGYEAYQCQGRCFYPFSDHLNPTKHAILQAILHSLSPTKVSRSCCVPIQLDPISILYVDNNGVLTYRLAYKDMVVRECGCR